MQRLYERYMGIGIVDSRREYRKEVMNMHDIRPKLGNSGTHQLSGADGIYYVERRGCALQGTSDAVVRYLQQVNCRACLAQHGDLLAHSGIFSSRHLVPIMQYEYAHLLAP